MALTRKLLKGMGLTEEQVDTIIEAHTDSLTAVKEERDSFKDKAEKYDGVSKELETLKKKSHEGDGVETISKEEYDKLKKQFDDYKSDISAKETKSAKEHAFREAIKAAGVSEKRIDTIIRASSADIDKIELDKDGKVKDSDKLVESVKTEWADFIVSTSVKGATTATPPTGGSVGAKTKEEILAIKDGGERRKAMAENAHLFGISEE